MSTSDLDYLRELVLFSEMDDDELLEINDMIKTTTYPGGYTLFFFFF